MSADHRAFPDLRRFRERRLMPVSELARKAGVPEMTIRGLEAGRTTSLERISRILMALGLPVFPGSLPGRDG
jgi:transcriptional regulator with XRE-family HTH domain